MDCSKKVFYETAKLNHQNGSQGQTRYTSNTERANPNMECPKQTYVSPEGEAKTAFDRAESFAKNGDKENAIKEYQKGERLIKQCEKDSVEKLDKRKNECINNICSSLAKYEKQEEKNRTRR